MFTPDVIAIIEMTRMTGMGGQSDFPFKKIKIKQSFCAKFEEIPSRFS